MQKRIWKQGIILWIILVFFGANIVPVVILVKADIVWDVTVNFTEPSGETDYVVFGEDPDAHDGPPVDANDTAKPPAPPPSYIRAYLKDGLPTPHDKLWMDYRSYPATAKVWNLSVQWYPEDEESPTTMTISWSPTEVATSEYTSVDLCTNLGVPLKNMLVDSSYTFSCPALVIQNFKIICAVASNQPPVANPDSYSTAEDTTLTIGAPGVLENDTDPNGDLLTVMKQSEPSHGTVTLNNNGGFTYIPAANYYGSDSFTYKVYDGTLYSDLTTVTLSIQAMNDAPVVTNIPNQTIAEGSSFSTIPLDSYVSDVDNSDAQMTWTYSGDSQLTVSIVNRVATITTPNMDWYGSETITFRATDPGGLWDEDAATFLVTNINDAPVVSDIPDQTILEGSTFSTIPLDSYVSDVDNSDAQMTWTYSGNSQLTVSIVNRVATIIVPSMDWSGSETITFRATDPGGLWDADAATFTVTEENTPPIVSDIPDQTIPEGSSFATIMLDNYVSDADHSDGQMTWTYSGNSQLTISIVNRVATITTPTMDWYGSETITFRATDPGGLWDADSAVFTVTSVNDPPVVNDIPDQIITKGSTFSTIPLDSYVSDVDNSDAQMTWTYSGDIQLTVSIVNRVATITTPDPDWSGSETITFRATDSGGLWDADAATFTVTGGNTPPFFGTPSPANGSNGNPLSFIWSIPITDVDGDLFSWSLTCSNGQTTSATNASNAIKSLSLSNLASSKTYTVWVNATDLTGSGNSTRRWYHFTTRGAGGSSPPEEPEPLNQPPIAVASIVNPALLFVNSEITFTGEGSSGPDGSITTWFWDFGDQTNGTGMTITHIYSHTGTYLVNLTVTDNSGKTDTDTIACVVQQPNRSPSAPSITGSISGTKNTSYTYTVIAIDADQDPLQYTFIWNTSASESSGFLPEGSGFTVNHSWTDAGRYLITVTVTDNHTTASSDITIYIDAVPTGEIGYLLDHDSDSIYDAFYSDELDQTFAIQNKDNHYLIDRDGDGTWDYTYDMVNGLLAYQEPAQTYSYEIILIALVIIALLLFLFWRRTSKKQQ